MKIGFFDSGVGGLTVLKEALREIKCNYIYFADNKNAPYGTKEKEIVKEYIFGCIDKLVICGCSIIVIACNTATSIAIKELREKYPYVIFIGTEPAIKVAIDDIHRRILVCATSLTIKGEKLLNLINRFNAMDIVDLIAADKLVLFAESTTSNSSEIKAYIKDILADIDKRKYSHLVLGCTHFSLYKEEFKAVVGENLKIIDGNIGIVKNLKRHLILKGIDFENQMENVELILSKEDSLFVNKAKKILGNEEIKYYKFDEL
ncbi:MAG: glutamate racemase [Clostridia bacterium]|nr:glutamate racemase [Clostridia bacterium]